MEGAPNRDTLPPGFSGLRRPKVLSALTQTLVGKRLATTDPSAPIERTDPLTFTP